MSGKWARVTERTFERHERFGGAPAVLITYKCPPGPGEHGESRFKEWIAVEHERFGRLAERWWGHHRGADPAPSTVDEFLRRTLEVAPVSEIRIEPDGKFWRITGRKFASARAVGNLIAAP